MKKSLYILLFISGLLTSCLNKDLEEFPAYEEAEITDFDFEHRFIVKNSNGVDKLYVRSIQTNATIDAENATITIDATVPGAGGDFTDEERNKVSLNNIVGYAKLSPAAIITPLNNAPKLGVPGDFSDTRRYEVKAADGTIKNWTITVNSFTK